MSKILLLSIRPRYAEKIFCGAKKFELRRTKPRLGADDLVLVYMSSPRCALTGAFVVSQVISGTPDEIWRKCGSKSEIDRAAFDSYYRGAKVAYAIGIERAWAFEQPVGLRELRRRMTGFHPPQLYRYLPQLAAAGLVDDELGAKALEPPRPNRLQKRPKRKSSDD